jgi:hypothetical protein
MDAAQDALNSGVDAAQAAMEKGKMEAVKMLRNLFQDIPDPVITMVCLFVSWVNKDKDPKRFETELKNLCKNLLDIPDAISSNVIAFVVRDGTIVDRMAALVPLHALSLFKAVMAVIKGDMITMREIISGEEFRCVCVCACVIPYTHKFTFIHIVYTLLHYTALHYTTLQARGRQPAQSRSRDLRVHPVDGHWHARQAGRRREIRFVCVSVGVCSYISLCVYVCMCIM